MDGGPNDKDRFRQRMVERVLTQFQAIPRAGPRLPAREAERGRSGPPKAASSRLRPALEFIDYRVMDFALAAELGIACSQRR